jgi:hypothetical protein
MNKTPFTLVLLLEDYWRWKNFYQRYGSGLAKKELAYVLKQLIQASREANQEAAQRLGRLHPIPLPWNQEGIQ